MTEFSSGKQLQSLITADGLLRVRLVPVETPVPSEHEVVVKVEAAPLNPSDIGTLLGPADPASFRSEAGPYGPELVGDITEARLQSQKKRLNVAMPVGNEGCGTIVAAGSGHANLIGRRVAIWGGGMYTQYRCLPLSDCMILPDGTEAADGAALFINPLTALGFIETVRREGHSAMILTAAASNLGQMLIPLCEAEGVGLICIVRSEEQVELLRGLGSAHVIVSTVSDFEDRLFDAVVETGATIAFDALGGGTLGNTLLSTMEAAASRDMSFNRYGSDVRKQLYIYAGLDSSPTVLTRSYGMAWSVGGWLLFHFLKSAGPEVEAKLRERVVAEMHGIFKSHYGKVITLDQMIEPELAIAYERKASGGKYLVRPTKAVGASGPTPVR